MPLELRKCTIEHIALVEPQSDAFLEKGYLLQPAFAQTIKENFSISAWDGTRCVAAAGFIPLYPHRATAWALMGASAGKYMREITRHVRRALDEQPYKRVEMLVDYKFDAGHRWAKMLGFQVEAERMIASGFFGNDETMYVRIKS